MALVFMEGFDYWDASSVPHNWSLGQTRAFTAGRWGGQQFQNSRTTGSGLVTSVAFPSTYTTIIVGAALQMVNPHHYLLVTVANATVADLRVNSGTGAIEVANSAGTLIATGGIHGGGFHYFELKIVVNGASGSCELHVDGISDIPPTTGNFGSTAVGGIGLSFSSGVSFHIDDVYAVDTTGSAPLNDFLGDVRVQTVMPVGAGGHTDFTPSAGANWQNVDEIPPDEDTTYNSKNVVGSIDTFNLTDIDTAATVLAVQENIYARKDDAGGPRQLAGLVTQGGVDYVGDTVTLGSGFDYQSKIYPLDLAGAAWTPATVNADEWGYELVT